MSQQHMMVGFMNRSVATPNSKRSLNTRYQRSDSLPLQAMGSELLKYAMRNFVGSSASKCSRNASGWPENMRWLNSGYSSLPMRPTNSPGFRQDCVSTRHLPRNPRWLAPHVLPPGTSMLPHMKIMSMTHWPAWVPVNCWSNARPHAMDAGLDVAYRRANA